MFLGFGFRLFVLTIRRCIDIDVLSLAPPSFLVLRSKRVCYYTSILILHISSCYSWYVTCCALAIFQLRIPRLLLYYSKSFDYASCFLLVEFRFAFCDIPASSP
ncbi:hypothetical protein F5880DRAFT_1732710 [Lentinula raphanica]|nr:hypothetical protein F5880DRAFT_1732710 [Lentinula raphanica]